jgi:hypothetical protein
LANRIGREHLIHLAGPAFAAGAVFRDVEIAGGELRRADAFQDRVFIRSRIGGADGERGGGRKQKVAALHFSDASK